ncbi:hypothetical protein [Gordonia sp. NB41Y]|uniref:hypothetical protein n=1 Tax=Gordonia sp. NB41Y TaxID=875808 RepID=UPI0006B21040|nr:hypothetical protein [Gordonia sp. NB41Y]WLP88814.1 hypothetical protein Q9K23_14475 [Gordonia sp. NB41Y]
MATDLTDTADITDIADIADTGTDTADADTSDADTADVTDTSEESSAASSTVVRTKPRRPSTTWVIAILAVLLVAAVGAAGYFGVQSRTDADSGAVSVEMRTQAVDTARDYAIKLSSFDYRDLNKNKDAIAAMSTENFAAKYSEMVGALTEIVTNGKGEATATVPHAAIEQIDPTKATVLLFVDQEARNVVAPDGKKQPYRMLVTLQRSGDRWLVDNVETI